MHIAILITNTDFSPFATARPDDGEKFATLLHEVRPHWRFTSFRVCKDAFPEDIAAFDGVLITGSPASVTDNAPWMQKLEGLIKSLIAARVPLFGACFGHQIIAKTLEVPVVRNDHGWGHGLLSVSRVSPVPWAIDLKDMQLYGSHIEQVGALPEGAVVTFAGPGLPIAGFALGDHVCTIQHHPEMTHDFITDLIEEYADVVGEAVTDAARTSLERPADRAEFAEEMARFFEYPGGR